MYDSLKSVRSIISLKSTLDSVEWTGAALYWTQETEVAWTQRNTHKDFTCPRYHGNEKFSGDTFHRHMQRLSDPIYTQSLCLELYMEKASASVKRL